MCTMTAMLATTIASTALSMGGQYMQAQQQANAQKAAAAYNAQAAENEAATRKQLAQNEIARGAAERSLQQRKAARAMGEARAGAGASGFQMDAGSVLSLLGESAEEHQYDSSQITSNANQAAWQHLAGASAASNNQAFAEYQGNQAGAGPGSWLGMGGTLLGGLGAGMNAYNQWGNSASASGNFQPNSYRPINWKDTPGGWAH